MKKFLYKSTLFIIVFCLMAKLFVYGTDSPLISQYGPTTEQQIKQSFNDVIKAQYDLILLGNSRIYRGINPNLFTVNSYNFAHDNDSFNQIFYKLVYLKDKGKLPKYLILGVDYFQFSFLSNTRNYIYNKYLSKEYRDDFDLVNLEEIKVILETHQKQFNLRAISSIRKSFKIENTLNVPHLKPNGQFITYGKAKENDKIDRFSNILDIQLNYYNKILNFCEKENIKIFLVMPPVRPNELINYDDETIDKINSIFESSTGENVYYLNFSQNDKFSIQDFQDITHLNIQGADKFTELLDKEIMNTIKSLSF